MRRKAHLDPTLNAYNLLPSGERTNELIPYDLPFPLPASPAEQSIESSTELGLIRLIAFFLKSHSLIVPSAEPAEARWCS